jgi:hypothetical protein
MDWIERIFHVSPDGGSGSLELTIAVGVVVAITMVLACVIKVLPAARRLFQRPSRSNRHAGPSLDRFDG